MKSKLGKMILLFIGLSLIFSGAAVAAQKIGYFEMPVVLKKSKSAQKSNDQFKKETEDIKADADKKVQEFKVARDEFEKKKGVMDEKSKTKKLEELRKMQAEVEKQLMETNARMNKLSGELTAPIVDKVIEIVRKIGRDDKYDFIFEREKAGIVFVNEKEDLTDRIIKELDK